MRKPIPGGVFFALTLAAMFACTRSEDGDEEDDNNFREDVIHCEDALARLAQCCPNFDAAAVGCEYYYAKQTGCGTTSTTSTTPALSPAESRCVRETTCEDLAAKGICQRAQEARAHTSKDVVGNSPGGGTSGSTTSTNETQNNSPVCP